jgi:hypothetical protein
MRLPFNQRALFLLRYFICDLFAPIHVISLALRFGMEKPGLDLKLSSLKRYIEAIGGGLSFDIELPDGTHYGFSV